MKITQNTHARQQKKYSRVIPKDIFDLNIPIYQRKILVLLYAIREQNIVSYQNISLRWNNDQSSSKNLKLRSQLKKHLTELERLGFLKRLKTKNKFTHVELIFDAFKDSEVINLSCEVLRDRSIDLNSLYVIAHYRLKNKLKANYWSCHSKDIGITRQTLSKWVRKSNNFDSKPFIKKSSQRIIPNFFLKKRCVPKNIFRSTLNFIIQKQSKNSRVVDKKNKLDDFLTLLLNYTNLNKNIRSHVKKTVGKTKLMSAKHTLLGVEKSQKRLSKKKLIEYLDLKPELFDRIVSLVRSKLNKTISFQETTIKLRTWIEKMVFDYENSRYYSFENDYVFSNFAANALNGFKKKKGFNS